MAKLGSRKPRPAAHRIRVGPAQARLAAMLLLTLRGMPTLYYGDEIGMLDVEIPPEKVQDPFEKNVPGRGLPVINYFSAAHIRGVVSSNPTTTTNFFSISILHVQATDPVHASKFFRPFLSSVTFFYE